MKYYLLISIALLLLSCGDSDDCNNPFNEAFVIEQNTSYCLPDGSTLEIGEITSSYCPCNADCIWSGEGLIAFTRTYENENIENGFLHEVLSEDNPSWISDVSVDVTQDCVPEIDEIRITINR